MVELVIGAPVHNRAWCLPRWFEAVEANVNPSETGLCFVVPPTDRLTRALISEYADRFAWCEILRDRNEAFDRTERRSDNHRSLALARNAILGVVGKVQPRHYISWDSDVIIGPGVLERMLVQDKPMMTIWTWLNRQPVRRVWHYPDFERQPGLRVEVEAQEPMCATVMKWERARIIRNQRRVMAHHLDPARWYRYARGVWKADVALAFQLMTRAAYGSASYAPHPYGEDIPFNWALHRAGVERWCYGEELGVHLSLDPRIARSESRLSYHEILGLARERPLGADYVGERSAELQHIGYYPVRHVGSDAA